MLVPLVEPVPLVELVPLVVPVPLVVLVPLVELFPPVALEPVPAPVEPPVPAPDPCVPPAPLPLPPLDCAKLCSVATPRKMIDAASKVLIYLFFIITKSVEITFAAVDNIVFKERPYVIEFRAGDS